MIYFVQAEASGHIKIGTTDCLGTRILQLKADAKEELIVLGISEGSFAEERQLHVRFASYRTCGEWFNPAEELLTFIKEQTSPWDGVAERIRITFDVPERIRRALNIEASRHGKSVGDVIESLVEQHCELSLRVADDSLSEGGSAGQSKRGRPRRQPSE